MKVYAKFLVAFTVVGGLCALATAQSGEAGTKPTKVRIGTYDSRAVAVAYAASSFNPVGEKMKEYESAKEAGENEKMAELEAWGKNLQRKLHFQGFGRVPVRDLLEPVKAGVAQVAADRRLAVIAMQCDHVSEGVEVIDVTEDLVELFNPTDRTREMARKVRDAEPLSLTELADLPAEQ